jgi:hypothetical protein
LSECKRKCFYQSSVNPIFKLKLLLIKHGKCSACKDLTPKVKYCGRCFNTRVEPEVLEAITALDLAAKFEENASHQFEDLTDDDYINPPRDSYFARVKEKKNKLEDLYKLMETAHGIQNEKQIFEELIREVLR